MAHRVRLVFSMMPAMAFIAGTCDLTDTWHSDGLFTQTVANVDVVVRLGARTDQVREQFCSSCRVQSGRGSGASE